MIKKFLLLGTLTTIVCYSLTTNNDHHLRSFEKMKISPTVVSKKQLKCVVDNVYHEARGEGRIGWMAVTYVTLNRAEDGRFPDSLCSVVKQRQKGICQFSWVCEQKTHKIKDIETYEKIEKTVENIVSTQQHKQLFDVTRGSLFYKRNDVKSSFFRENLRQTVTIGNHTFYEEKARKT